MAVKSAIPPIDETDKHAAWALYMGGFDAAEIVERVQCNINTLKSWISQDGWFKKREAVNAARREKNPPEQSAIAKVFAPEKKAENVKIFQEKSGEIAVQNIKYIADELTPAERIEMAPNISSTVKTDRASLDLDKDEPGERGAININFLNSPYAVRVIEQPVPAQLEDEA